MRLSGLEGKVAVVTGAGRMRSIGRPIAIELARQGCDVVLTSIGRVPQDYPDDERAAGWRDIDSVADEIRAEGRRALPLVSDVADYEAVEALLDAALADFGRVDFVINNAGAARGADRVPVIDLDPDLWRLVLDVNLNGVFYTSQVFGRQLIEQGSGGAITNLSSIAGKMLGPNTAVYASSKAGLQALTACMAQEVGKHGVRVNAICPGIIDTSRMDDMGHGDFWQRTIDARIPMGRAGTGADIASITAFMCATEGDWITGQSYNVDGGTCVQH